MKIQARYFILVVALLAACGEGRKGTGGTERTEETKGTGTVQKKKHVSYLEALFERYELVDLHSVDTSIQVDLRYAGTNNFLKMDLYDGLDKAYFNCETAIRLSNAQYFLKQQNPNYSLVVLDAARPHQIQKLMWDSLRMPPEIKYNYLAPPYDRSMHNYGCAADVSIIDRSTNTLLDMGSGFDEFTKLSEPGYEWKFLKSGALSKQAYSNRILLRKAMLRAKFITIHSEWWHFSSYGRAEGMVKYKLIK